MRYFVRARDGKRYGPADLATLNAWAEEGRIGPSTTLETEDHDKILAFALPGLQLRDSGRPVPTRVEMDWAVGGTATQMALSTGYQPLIKPGPAETHFVKNAIHLVIGFLPVTLLALAFSLRTDRQNQRGEFRDAERSSDQAKFWGDVSLLVGLGLFLMWLLIPMFRALRDWR